MQIAGEVSELPGMARWLGHIVTVMGECMFATGALTIAPATSRAPARPQGTSVVLVAVGLATGTIMRWVTSVIDSRFEWLLLVPAVVWCAGVAAYAFERNSEMRHAGD